MILKPLAREDIDSAAALHAACFPDPWPAHAFSALMDTGAEGLAIIENGTMLAVILVRAAADEAEILTFAVRPDSRRQGLGTRLLLQAIVVLEGKGITEILLEVAEDNTGARSLYQTIGFLPVGQRSGYYAGTSRPIDALIMSKRLQP